jgi:Mg-chelatase subunit ChlD
MKRFILVAAAAIALAAAASAAPRPRVEVTFVLDSTGSMGGLIEGAKQKIWSIANSIISRRPAPDVRIGLVTYRDRGDDYVTRSFDLTDDIDTVFRNLQTFQADGGGDDPESVNQALDEAVNRMSWSADASVLKIMFLVGDYPPHMDYADDVKYTVTCVTAAKRGLIINTVQCGDVPETRTVWQDIARRSEGAYVALAQSGNMTAVATPWDDEIARVSAEIGATVIPYGDPARQAEAMSKVSSAAGAPASVAADRAAYNLASGGKAIQGGGDLVADSSSGAVDLASLKDEQLPPELRKLTPAERRAYVARQQSLRAELNAKLSDLSQKRADYIAKEQARLAGQGDSFDAKVAEIIAAEAARVK